MQIHRKSTSQCNFYHLSSCSCTSWPCHSMWSLKLPVSAPSTPVWIVEVCQIPNILKHVRLHYTFSLVPSFHYNILVIYQTDDLKQHPHCHLTLIPLFSFQLIKADTLLWQLFTKIFCNKFVKGFLSLLNLSIRDRHNPVIKESDS